MIAQHMKNNRRLRKPSDGGVGCISKPGNFNLFHRIPSNLFCFTIGVANISKCSSDSFAILTRVVKLVVGKLYETCKVLLSEPE